MATYNFPLRPHDNDQHVRIPVNGCVIAKLPVCSYLVDLATRRHLFDQADDKPCHSRRPYNWIARRPIPRSSMERSRAATTSTVLCEVLGSCTKPVSSPALLMPFGRVTIGHRRGRRSSVGDDIRRTATSRCPREVGSVPTSTDRQDQTGSFIASNSI